MNGGASSRTRATGVSRRGEIALYAIGAVAMAALATSVFPMWVKGTPPGLAIAAALPGSVLLGCIGLASRYLCRALPLGGSSRSTIAAAVIGSAVVASGLWVFTWQTWVDELNRRTTLLLKPDYSLLFGLGVLLYLGTVAVQYLILEIDVSREAEDAALRYRVLAREAELRALKAQVDPHFLFNSLNAIASLCGSRPLDAREMAQRLADFFRLVLRLGSLERITLAEEIDLVTRYLAIEKVRFGDRLNVKIAVDEDAGRCFVPPLLLQPLVENAVRHGIASMVEGGTIDIEATLRDGLLRILVDNPADPDRVDSAGERVGLQNARGRLNTASEGLALLQTVETGGRFRVYMELPR